MIIKAICQKATRTINEKEKSNRNKRSVDYSHMNNVSTLCFR